MSDVVELRDVDERWPVVDTEDLHRDGWVMSLRRDTIRAPHSDKTFARLVLEHPGAAVVLAMDGEQQVLCLRQYRHPAERRFLELPAGLLDAPGEDALTVAKRELREEAAYAAKTWRHLTSAYSSPGISAEQIHYFLATDLELVDRGDFVLEHEEADMEMVWVPFGDLLDAVLAGHLTDAPLIIAVLAVHALGLADPS